MNDYIPSFVSKVKSNQVCWIVSIAITIFEYILFVYSSNNISKWYIKEPFSYTLVFDLLGVIPAWIGAEKLFG